MDTRSDVVILGGGVIGLTTALLLGQTGARVSVVERGYVGCEASWAAAGIIPPGGRLTAKEPWEQLRALSNALIPPLAEQLRSCTGIDTGYRVCGGLLFADSPDDNVTEWYGSGALARDVSGAALHALEPNLSHHRNRAIHLPELAQLRSPWHLRALRAACLAISQVKIFEQTKAHKFLVTAGNVSGVETSRGVFPADWYVLTSGAWTDSLLTALWKPLPVHPVRGQMLLFHTEPMLVRQVLLAGSRYLVPRGDGKVLVGSTQEMAGFDKRTTREGLTELHAFAAGQVPALGSAAPVQSWAGLRPGTPDGLPYLGPVPGHPRVWVAAGHYRAGLQTAAGTAQLLTQVLHAQKPTISLAPFALDRSFVGQQAT